MSASAGSGLLLAAANRGRLSSIAAGVPVSAYRETAQSAGHEIIVRGKAIAARLNDGFGVVLAHALDKTPDYAFLHITASRIQAGEEARELRSQVTPLDSWWCCSSRIPRPCPCGYGLRQAFSGYFGNGGNDLAGSFGIA
jgi:hypothetical protein